MLEEFWNEKEKDKQPKIPELLEELSLVSADLSLELKKRRLTAETIDSIREKF